MNKTFALSILLLFLLLSATAEAQEPGDTLVLDLYKSVDIALGSSPDAFYSSTSMNLAWLGFRGASFDLYSPIVDLNLNLPSYQQALTEQLIYDPALGRVVRVWVNTENQRWLAELGVTQPLPTGGQVRIESNIYRRLYSSDLTGEDDLEYSSSYRLIFTQELLRGNLARYSKELAELAWESARLNGVQTQRGLVFSVLESYYSLLAARQELSITSDVLSANRETADLARRKFDAGLIPEVEAFQFELEVSRTETELLSAEAAYESQLDRYRTLLGLPLDVPLKLIGEPEFDTIDVDPVRSVERALAHREEIRQAEIMIEQAEKSVDNSKRPWRIGSQVSAFYNLDLREDTIDEAFSPDYEDYSINRGFALNVNVPLFSGGRRNVQVQQAEISMRRVEFDAGQAEREVVLDVKDAIRSLRESRLRYQISRRTLEIADQTYDISRQRFENGQITAQDLIDAQLSLNRTRISTLRALIDHNIAQARYRLAVGEPVLPGVEITPSSIFDPKG